MAETASPFRSHFYGGAAADPGDPRGNPNFHQDYKEKRKLLIRWSHYFPHEHVKEFDVSNPPKIITFLAERFQAPLHPSLFLSLLSRAFPGLSRMGNSNLFHFLGKKR